jgi:hypothetical protein
LGFCAILLGVFLAVQGLHRYIMFESGNQTSGLSSAVAPDEESLNVNWLRAHGKPNDLVLAPVPSAPWIATAPIHAPRSSQSDFRISVRSIVRVVEHSEPSVPKLTSVKPAAL